MRVREKMYEPSKNNDSYWEGGGRGKHKAVNRANNIMDNSFPYGFAFSKTRTSKAGNRYEMITIPALGMNLTTNLGNGFKSKKKKRPADFVVQIFNGEQMFPITSAYSGRSGTKGTYYIVFNLGMIDIWLYNYTGDHVTGANSKNPGSKPDYIVFARRRRK